MSLKEDNDSFDELIKRIREIILNLDERTHNFNKRNIAGLVSNELLIYKKQKEEINGRDRN
jgi:wobble nucleotide-excising tRNase